MSAHKVASTEDVTNKSELVSWADSLKDNTTTIFNFFMCNSYNILLLIFSLRLQQTQRNDGERRLDVQGTAQLICAKSSECVKLQQARLTQGDQQNNT